MPERPPLDGWIPEGWQPADRIQDISPSLPDGYWLDPIKLERANCPPAAQQSPVRRGSLGRRRARRARRGARRATVSALQQGRRASCPPGACRSPRRSSAACVTADHGGLTDGALVEMLRERNRRGAGLGDAAAATARLGAAVPDSAGRRRPVWRAPVALLLSRGDLARLLDFDAVIDAVDVGVRRLQRRADRNAAARGRRAARHRRRAAGHAQRGAAEPPALGAKIVSVFRGNAARGLPTVTSIYVLSDYETGKPLAIMDGGYLTAIRTAAGSAVATRLLARAGRAQRWAYSARASRRAFTSRRFGACDRWIGCWCRRRRSTRRARLPTG